LQAEYHGIPHVPELHQMHIGCNWGENDTQGGYSEKSSFDTLEESKYTIVSSLFSRKILKKSSHLLMNLLCCNKTCIMVCNEHDVPISLDSGCPNSKSFSKPTLHPIPDDCVSYLFTYGKTATSKFGVPWKIKGKEHIRLKSFSTLLNQTKFIPFSKSFIFRPTFVRQVFLELMVGTSRERPFERRRRITFRPPGLRIFVRKPWERFRLILLGWYVRFMNPPKKYQIKTTTFNRNRRLVKASMDRKMILLNTIPTLHSKEAK